MKPFISYIGSKQKFMKKIEPYLPKEINNYYEPFVGGGSMFFHINQHYDIKKNYINDLDTDLINAYKVIKNDADNLMKYLDALTKFSSKKDFDKLVNIYNDENIDKTLRTALFIFIVKRSYNGKLQYNKNNEGIRPYYSADHNKKILFDQNNIENISKLLKKTIISNKDYMVFLNNNEMKNKDFVFLDPPYLVDNKNFYKIIFDIEDFKNLKNMCDYLDNKNVNFMITLNKNSILKDIFKNYNIYSFKKHSYISGGKGSEYEMIITNYTG